MSVTNSSFAFVVDEQARKKYKNNAVTMQKQRGNYAVTRIKKFSKERLCRCIVNYGSPLS